MTSTLEDLITDCQANINTAAGETDLQEICRCAERAAASPEFVAQYFGPEAEAGMHTLYQDPEKGFMILAHIRETGFKSRPHDHGASWAVYCQIKQDVEMEEYTRTDDGKEEGSAELELSRRYTLNPGEAGYFDAFQIHSIEVPENARFLRITGTDLSRLETSSFNVEERSVSVNAPNDQGKVSGDVSA